MSLVPESTGSEGKREKCRGEAGLGEGNPSLCLSFLLCIRQALCFTPCPAPRREEGGGESGPGKRRQALTGWAASQVAQSEPWMVEILVQFALNLVDKLINVETAVWILFIKSNFQK